MTAPGPTDVDDVAVTRRLNGDTSVRLNRAETVEAWQRLERDGVSAREAARRLGVTARSVQRWRTGRVRPYPSPSRVPR